MLSHLKPYLSNDLSLLNSISFVHLPMDQSPFLLGASRLHCLIYKVHPVRCDGFFILPLPSALVKYLFPFPVSPTGTVPDSPRPRGCPPLQASSSNISPTSPPCQYLFLPFSPSFLFLFFSYFIPSSFTITCPR